LIGVSPTIAGLTFAGIPMFTKRMAPFAHRVLGAEMCAFQ